MVRLEVYVTETVLQIFHVKFILHAIVSKNKNKEYYVTKTGCFDYIEHVNLVPVPVKWMCV